jgi:ABC-type branched-subunit amino acid transport system permease subunit
MAIVGAVLPVLAVIPPFTLATPTNAWMDGFTNAGVFVLLAIGLNLVVGVAGLLDLGYAAFFAIGAYTYSYVASPFGNSILGFKFVEVVSPDLAGLVFWPMLLVGALVAALFGILLGAPTLRLRGDYLAIVTLGFGEIVPIVFLNADAVTNGTNGVGGLARPALPIIGSFSALNPWPYYISMLVIVTVVMILAYRLVESRIGRAWEAIREDELAAAASGINTVTAKLLAFALGASIAGIAGVFNASKLVTVSPDQFTFIVSFTVLAMVVLGGMGNFWGVAVGAFVIYTINNVLLKVLNQFFDQIQLPSILGFDIANIDFIQLQFLLYGLALVAMMLWRPEGLFPNSRRQRELHTAMTEPGEDELATAEATSEEGQR